MKAEKRSSAPSSIGRRVVIVTTALCVVVLAGAAVLAAVGAFNDQQHDAKDEAAGPPIQEAQAAPRRNQPAPPPAPAANPPAPSAPSATPPAAPAPQAAPAPSAPIRTETVVYDNWTVACRDTVGGTAKKICSASFQMTEKERNAVIFSWVIGRDNEGALVSVLNVPTGLIVQSGLQLKLDNGAARKLDFTLCDTRHCEATIKMDDALTKEMAGAKAAIATIVAPDGKGINFNMIPTGIDKAISSIPR